MVLIPHAMRRARLKAPGLRFQVQGQDKYLLSAASDAQRAGFTFVELLIAATMMSVLFIGLATHLRGGIMVWQRATSTSERLQQERVTLEQLERDLSNAFVYDDRETSYGLQPGKLPPPSFGNGQLALFTSQPSTVGRPSVQFVRYACTEQNGIRGLWRMSQSMSEARLGPPRQPSSPLLAGCEALVPQFAYLPSGELTSIKWDELVWSDQWFADARKKLPRFIDLTIRLESEREIRRIFTLPAGVLEVHPESPS